MRVIKTHSHKNGLAILERERPLLLQEVDAAINNILAPDCLRKETQEQSKVNRWGGLLFSPRAINEEFREKLLYPHGWLEWDAKAKKYREPRLTFATLDTANGTNRVRKMDGIKERVGLEVQCGKYAFMGYDIFSKMIIFKNHGEIDWGIEIVVVQAMIECMSTGVSAFEHIMIDFTHRGEADIDIPVCVIGIGPTEQEWDIVKQIQAEYKSDPAQTRLKYPKIGKLDLKRRPLV